jgi:3-hydroxyacyl-CoA dehydrogenase/enoyl-CoA hydratase/3-hydroxybutyryl-CoA epimerase
MVNTKTLGKKTGSGFYTFKKGQIIRPKIPGSYTAPSDVTERLILRLLNETMACLREHVTETQSLIDAGIIFGTGFAPFRGGPLQYVKDRGQEQVTMALENLEKIHGARFKPDVGWKTIKVE